MSDTAGNAEVMASYLRALSAYVINTTEPIKDTPLFVLDLRHAGAPLLAEMVGKQDTLDYSGYTTVPPSADLPIGAFKNGALPNKTLVTFDTRIFSETDIKTIADMITTRFGGDSLEIADLSVLVRPSVAADYPNGELPKDQYGLTIQDSVLQAIVSEASVRRGNFVRQVSPLIASLVDGDLEKLPPAALAKLQQDLKGIWGPDLVINPSGSVSFVTPDEQTVVILPSDTPDGKTPTAEALVAQLGQFSAPANISLGGIRQR